MQDYWKGPLPVPQVRRVEEMRAVLHDPGCPVDAPLYFMYRDLAMSDADRTWLNERDIRFDITVIPPMALCGEYVKTKGHYHPPSPGGPGYPELYQVASGTAHYLLQHHRLDDVAVVAAHAGDMVLIPPDYGHVTINPAQKILVMANLVSRRFSSVYEAYEARQGALYYELVGGEWVANARYESHPPLRFVEPVEIPDLCIEGGGSLYGLVGREECIDYLNHPERYRDIMAYL